MKKTPGKYLPLLAGSLMVPGFGPCAGFDAARAQQAAPRAAAAAPDNAADKATEPKPDRILPGASGPADTGGTTDETAGKRADSRLWRFDLTTLGVYDSNINQDEEDLDSFGIILGLGVHYRNRAEQPSFELDYGVANHSYSNTDRWDRVSHDLTASYERELSSLWSLQTVGEIALKGSSEDRDLADQYTLLQRAEYRLSRRNRFQLFAAYRVKRNEDDPGRSAIDPYVGFRLERRLSGERRLQLGYRYDRNRARESRNSYLRSTYSLRFITPLSDRDRLTLEARVRPQRYPDRLVEVGHDDDEVPRQDRRYILEASWERELSRDLDLNLSYKFETRSSNDPDKEFSEHLPIIGLTYHW